MKRLAALLIGLSIGSGLAWGQNLHIAKDQARRAAGSDSGGPAAPAASPQTPAMDPAVAATLKSVNELRATFSAIAAAPDATQAADQRIALLNQFASAAKGKKPSTASIRKLAGDLVNFLPAKKLTAADSQKLARSVYALFNSANQTDSQQEALLAEVKKYLARPALPKPR